MDEQESSSGMMIGMIIGGVTALVVIVAGIFGVAWYSLMDARGPVRDPGPPAMAEFEEVAPKAEVKGPVVEDGPPWPNPKRVAEQEQKILGAWTAAGFKDGRTEIWEVRADKTMDVTVQHKGKADAVTKGKWELLVDLGGALEVSIRYDKDHGGRTAWCIRYLDADRFVVVPTVTVEVDGVAVKTPDHDVQYQRKRAEKKP